MSSAAPTESAGARVTDRLDLANAFAAAGIECKAAERIASTIFDAIREPVR
jgi:hypothetical protein